MDITGDQLAAHIPDSPAPPEAAVFIARGNRCERDNRIERDNLCRRCARDLGVIASSDEPELIERILDDFEREAAVASLSELRQYQ